MTGDLELLTLVGNPKVGSRTLQVGEELARQLAEGLTQAGRRVRRETIDIASLGAELLDWQSAKADAAIKQAIGADLLIVTSPTYKATYTGLLKLFLDRINYDGLAGRVAVPVMVAAAPIHALAVETHLRPLLVELGASCPTRGLCVLESQLAELESVIGKFVTGALPALVASLRISAREKA